MKAKAIHNNIEKEIELTKEKSALFKPKANYRLTVDDDFWCIHANGKVLKVYVKEIKQDLLEQNNAYPTEEIAELAAKRDVLNRTPSTDIEGEYFWMWSFEEKKAMNYSKAHRKTFIDCPCFATEEECQAWGEEAQEVYPKFRELIKNFITKKQ